MDVDGDGVVTTKDVVAVAKAQPSEVGDRRWNTAADVNEDGKVDGHDLHMVVRARGDADC